MAIFDFFKPNPKILLTVGMLCLKGVIALNSTENGTNSSNIRTNSSNSNDQDKMDKTINFLLTLGGFMCGCYCLCLATQSNNSQSDTMVYTAMGTTCINSACYNCPQP